MSDATSDDEPVLVTALFDAVMEFGTVTPDGLLFNATEAFNSLIGVAAYVAAMRPDLNTPQRIRLFSQEVAKDLQRLIPSARQAIAEDGHPKITAQLVEAPDTIQ